MIIIPMTNNNVPIKLIILVSTLISYTFLLTKEHIFYNVIYLSLLCIELNLNPIFIGKIQKRIVYTSTILYEEVSNTSRNLIFLAGRIWVKWSNRKCPLIKNNNIIMASEANISLNTFKITLYIRICMCINLCIYICKYIHMYTQKPLDESESEE